MKTASSLRSKAFRVAASGVSLAAVQASTIHETGNQTLIEVESKAVVSAPIKFLATPADSTRQDHVIVLENETEWDGTSLDRFNELSRKFALARLTAAQATEYENLKTLRRRENPSRTFAQIKADIELHQAVHAAIAGLQQLIDHGTRTFRAET